LGDEPTIIDRGQHALRQMEHAIGLGFAYPLVLLDAHMPDADGFWIADQIKNNPRYGESKVVMLTSVGLRGDTAKSRKAGASAYLGNYILD